MNRSYASVDDVITIGRALATQELEKAERLLETASAKLRLLAKKYDRDIDKMIADDPDIGVVAKETIVKAVLRALDAYADDTPPAVQASQAAMGYSVSMTYVNAGQALYFLKNELKELGLLRQRYGAIEVYGNEN